jgi:hypothetical protein
MVIVRVKAWPLRYFAQESGPEGLAVFSLAHFPAFIRLKALAKSRNMGIVPARYRCASAGVAEPGAGDTFLEFE